MNPSLVLTLDQWQAMFEAALDAVSRAQEAIKKQLGFWGIVRGLWRCAFALKAAESQLKIISEAPSGVVAEDSLRALIPVIRRLVASIEGLVDTGKRCGLTNRTLTASSLGIIRLAAESIADHLDSIEMSLDPDVLSAIETGREQIARGEFEIMGRLPE